MLTFLFSLLFCSRGTGPGAWAWYKRTQFGYKTADTNKETQLESLTFTSNDFVPFSVSYIESYSGSVSNLDIWFSLSVQKWRINLIITRERITITKRKLIPYVSWHWPLICGTLQFGSALIAMHAKNERQSQYFLYYLCLRCVRVLHCVVHRVILRIRLIGLVRSHLQDVPKKCYIAILVVKFHTWEQKFQYYSRFVLILGSLIYH